MKIDDLKIRVSSDGCHIDIINPEIEDFGPIMSTEWWGSQIILQPNRNQIKAIIRRLVNCYNEKYGADE